MNVKVVEHVITPNFRLHRKPASMDHVQGRMIEAATAVVDDDDEEYHRLPIDMGSSSYRSPRRLIGGSILICLRCFVSLFITLLKCIFKSLLKSPLMLFSPRVIRSMMTTRLDLLAEI